MDAFPEGSPGPKLDTSLTSYTGAGGITPKPQYSGVVGEESLKLLSNAQAFGTSRPEGARHDGSPYRSDVGGEYDGRGGGGDIGVPQSAKYPPKWDDSDMSAHTPGLAGPQESGLIAPYPEYGHEGLPARREGNLAIPYFDPPPTDPNRGRKGR